MTPPLASEQHTQPEFDELLRQRALFKTINEFAVKLLSIPDEEELAWYVTREVVGRLGFDDCVLYYTNAAGTHLRQAAAIGLKNPAGEEIVNFLEIPLGQGITGSVAEVGEALIINDLRQDSRYIPDLEPALSEICVPLIIDGAVVGVIDCEDPRAGFFGQDHLEILETIAAMSSARLKLLRESEFAEAQLRQSLELEAIVELTGGIAHDFNNIFSVILGNADLIKMQDSTLADETEAIVEATRRGASLTQRLLAYTRKRSESPGPATDIDDMIRSIRNSTDAGPPGEYERPVPSVNRLSVPAFRW